METKVNFGGNPVTLAGTHLKAGDKAPEFTVAGADLQPEASRLNRLFCNEQTGVSTEGKTL